LIRDIFQIFISSLKRISEKAELTEYGYKGIKEIVKLDLFDYSDVINGYVSHHCPEFDLYLIDGVLIDFFKVNLLNRFFFKEVRVISEDYDEEKVFAPYRDLFPEKKFPCERRITIITL